MKSLSKKLFALLGCAAILASSFTVPVMAEDNIITIHAGDYPNLEVVNAAGETGYYNTTVYQNDVNGGKFIHLAADESDRGSVEGFKVIVPFEVSKDGRYNINMDMCSLSMHPATYKWNSPVKLKIDDGEYFRVKAFSTTSDPNITATVLNTNLSGKYSADSEKARWAEYALDPKELTAGAHTLTFWVYDKPPLQGKDWFVFGLGDINISPTTESSDIIVEGEDLLTETGSSAVAGEGFSNGNYLNVTADRTVRKEFYVPEDGYYRLNAIATDVAAYSVDGTTVSFKTTEEISELDGWKKYIGKIVELKKGVHHLEITTNMASTAAKVYKLDYVTFTSETDLSDLYDVTIHAGDYPNLETVDAEGNKGIFTTTVFSNSENGGKFIHLAADESDKGSVEGFKVIVPFKAYGTGVYDISVDMCSHTRLLNSERWNSPVKLKVDDGEYVRIKAFSTEDDANVTAEVLNADLAEKYSADSEKARWAKYTLEPMELTEGEHTLTFWVYDKPSLQSKDWFVFGLGEINITRSPDDASIVIEGEDLLIENASNAVVENGYSNGQYMNATDDIIIRKKFSVPETGSYKLQAFATSTIDYSIDGNILSFEKTEDLSNLISDGWEKYVTESITLQKGVHQLEIKTGAETIAYKLDCIDIFCKVDITEIELSDIDVLAIGESADLIVKNQDGKIISINNFDSVSYESSNENIIKINGLGRTEIINPGEATITIKGTANGKNLTDSTKVIIAGKSGLYLKKTTVNGNDVSVTVGSFTDAPVSKAFIGVCKVKDGITTSFTDVKFIEFATMSAGKTKTETVSMSSISDGDLVVVSVFDGTDILKHLWGKSITEQ